MTLIDTSIIGTQPTHSLDRQSGLEKDTLKISKTNTFNMFGKDGFTFFDMLDILNPLQHLPGISFLYRKITGDTIDPGSRIIGGAILGGPIGAIANLVDVMVQHKTGKGLAESATSFFLANDQREDTSLAKGQTPSTEGNLEIQEVSPEAPPHTVYRNNEPKKMDHHGMSAIPVSATSTRGKGVASRGRNDPPELFASVDPRIIDKINLETRFLEQQAVNARKAETKRTFIKELQSGANSGDPLKTKKLFENSMLSALEKYQTTMKLSGLPRHGHETLKVGR